MEEDILIGGCLNGQVVIWDIGEYTEDLIDQDCIWDHSVVTSKLTGSLHVDDGFIPILYWSAESDVVQSHKNPVEDLKWLPANVWFSNESAFPKVNQNENNRQFITCAADMFILVWDFLRPASDGGEGGPEGQVDENVPPPVKKIGKTQWAKLKARSTLAPISSGGAKWTPAMGKYR